MTQPQPEPQLRKRARAVNPQRWLLIAGHSATILDKQNAIQDLLFARHRVRVAWGRGSLRTSKLKYARPYQLLRPHRDPGLLHWAGMRVRHPFAPVEQRLASAASTSPWLIKEARGAARIVLLDREAESLLPWLANTAPDADVTFGADAERLIRHEAATRWLEHEAQWLDNVPPDEPLNARHLRKSLTRLDDAEMLAVPPSIDVRPQLRRVGRRRLRQGGYLDVRACVQAGAIMSRRFGSSMEDQLLAGLALHVDIVEGASPPPDFAEMLRMMFAASDSALESGDLVEAAARSSIPIGLLFHQQLHTAVALSPLSEEPREFLAPFTDSAVGQALTSPSATSSASADPETGERGRRRVLVMPGVYPHHAPALIHALDGDDRADVTVLPQSGPAFAGMMIEPLIVLDRLVDHAGAAQDCPDLGEFSALASEAMSHSDVIVADWADKGAAWTSIHVPSGVRLILRVHSVDVLSAQVHLVDWHRVDDVIFVSEHIRDMFNDVVGPRADYVRQHVITNMVSAKKFTVPSLPDANRTIGMVGWAQRVKDPMLALDILEELLQHDSAWRLRLIGADFIPSQVTSDTEYVRAFRERLLSPGLVDHVDLPGFTRRLEQQLPHVGFILSTSLRESCPVGVLEGTAAGAVPVVREWPVFARYQGARRLFPEGQVFDTVDEAVDTILRLSQPEDRQAASERVLEHMSDNFSESGNEKRLLDLILL
ncbi:MAG: hypothetical protein WBB15_09750 [Ornithinimicrobium sp.]